MPKKKLVVNKHDNQDLLFKIRNEELTENNIKFYQKRARELFLLSDLVVINDLEGIKILIEKVGVDINKAKKLTPLMIAAQKGYFNIFKYLLEKGADYNRCTIENRNALIYAAENGHAEIIRYMVDEKNSGRLDFKPNVAAHKNQYTALMFATCFGHKESVEQLLRLKEIDINALDSEKGHALMICACQWNSQKNKEYMQIAQMLLAANSDIYARDTMGVNTLMTFSRKNNSLGMLLILDRCKKINPKNPTEAIKKFVNEKTTQSWTALHFAADEGGSDVIPILLRHGADIDALDSKSTTPLIHAIEKNYKLAQRLVQGYDIINLDQQKVNVAANVNIINEFGSDALFAALYQAYEFVKEKKYSNLRHLLPLIHQLIDKTLDVDKAKIEIYITSSNIRGIKNSGYATSLALAATIGNRKLVRLLLEKGASFEYYMATNLSILRDACLDRNKSDIDGKNKKITFPLLFRAKLIMACKENETKNNKSEIDNKVELEGETIKTNKLEAINILVDFLTSDEPYLGIQVLPNNDIGLMFSGIKQAAVFNNKDLAELVDAVQNAISIQENQKPDDLLRIIKSSKPFFKLEMQQIAESIDDEFVKCALQFHHQLSYLSQLYTFHLGLQEKLKSENSSALDQYDDKFSILYTKAMTLGEDFLNQNKEQREKFTQLQTINPQEARKITQEINANFKTFSDAKEQLMELQREITIMLEQKETHGKLLKSNINNLHDKHNKSTKKKTKDKFTVIFTVDKQAPKAQRGSTQTEAQISSQNNTKQNNTLLSNTVQNNMKPKRIEDIRLRSDAELKALHSELTGTTSTNTNTSNLNQTYLAKLDAEKSKAKRNSKKNNLSIIPEKMDVLDQVNRLSDILKFNSKENKELEFLETNALWGGFNLLMESLKNFHGPKLFSESLALILRNFGFHEDGELKLIWGKSVENSGNQELHLKELREMTHQLIKYFSHQDVKADSSKKSTSLNSILPAINSPLFTRIVEYALTRAKEQSQNLSSQIPSLQVCISQISRSETELNIYKKVCTVHPELLDDPIGKTVILVGLGNTVARLGSYVASTKLFYRSAYKSNKLEKYDDYIEAGNLYRHKDNYKAMDWRIIIASLVEEILLGYFLSTEPFLEKSIEDKIKKEKPSLTAHRAICEFLPLFAQQIQQQHDEKDKIVQADKSPKHS